MKNKSKSKKAFCLILLIIMLIVPLWYYNNYSIKINNQTLYSDKVTDNIHLTLLSDLHATQFDKDNTIIIEKVRTTSPDIIFILGDMYSRWHQNDIDKTVELVNRLSEIADVYIITGDHDTDDLYKQKLKSLDGVTYLAYDKKDITVNGNKISIYGIDNVYFTPTFDLKNEFNEPDDSALNILLSHIPSVQHLKSFGADIIFSGDTHGGLIRLPWLGPAYYDGYILPEITYSGTMTDKGLYKIDSTSLFVTSGLGNYPFPLRFNNRPEICSITITKGE